MHSHRGQLGVFWLLVAGAVVLTVLTVTLLFGMLFVGSVATDLGGSGDPINKTASPNPETAQAVNFENTNGPNEILQVYQVNDSTGYAIELTGTDDSFYKSHSNINLASDENWSVSTWARVDDDAGSKNMTAISANGRVIIQYNGSDGNWSAWYYDDGTGNSYVLETSAPDQPGNLTLVTTTANDTHFKLYRNNSLEATANLSTSNVEDADLNATNWDGTLDEARVFDDATNDSEQSDLYNNPVAPRPERNRTARLMFDEGSGDRTAIYFTRTYADLSNHTWVTTGLNGHILTDGVDYTINQDSGTITALDGGPIDGAPVVWIDYEYRALEDVGQVGQNIAPAFELFGQAVLVIPAIAVLGVLIAGLLAAVSMAGSSFGNQSRGNR